MVVCQAVFGYKAGVQSHQYFHFFFSQVEDAEVTEIIVLLEYLVRNLKNKSSILIYLQALLEFEKSQQNFYLYKLDDLAFIIELVEESEYFEVSTYSIEALTLLYELMIIINREEFAKSAKRIMKKWVRQMNRAECNNFCYLFCFREVKKIFPFILENEEKNTKDRILRHSNLILELLDEESLSKDYIETMSNKISVELKRGSGLKEESRARVEVEILRNQKIEFTLEVLVRSPSHGYFFKVKNERCFVSKEVGETGTGKANRTIFKEENLKELAKNPESIPVRLDVLNKSKSTLVLSILGHPIEVCHESEEGVFSTIEIVCDSKAYFHNITITNPANGEVLKQISEHLEVLKNIEVRTKFLPRINLKQMLEKFDFERMFCIWGELLKNTKSCSPVSGFQMLVKLSFLLLRQL